MKHYLGIDLGSTTTKAVILDENEQVVGRGITNTRSNYHVATEVARAEAFYDARFTVLRSILGADERLLGAAVQAIDVLAAEFRFQLEYSKFTALREACFDQAAKTHGGSADIYVEAIRDILDELDAQAHDLFSPAALDQSQFFRDIIGSKFLVLADREARGREIAFESLMGIYDKCILKVENEAAEDDFARVMPAALSKSLNNGLGSSTDAAQAAALTEDVQKAIDYPLEIINTVGTGYGRQRLPFRKDQICSEILCHGLGAHFMFPNTRTVLDIGGQDTKAIQVDGQGIVTSFHMNDRCAAGCGRYLGYIADELNIGLHELGPLAQKADRQVRISSTCTVFAGAELRDLLNLGVKRENILSGLHRSIILRAMSLLARSGGVDEEFTFTGGVAKNPAVVDALTQLIGENYGDRTLNIHPDSIYTGAVGGALFAGRAGG